MKQETLEEDVEKSAHNLANEQGGDDTILRSHIYASFIEGAEWLANQLYSEEDMRKAIKMAIKGMLDSGVKGWTTITEDEIIQSIKQSKHE
jgi:hypothetical protein